MREIGGRSFQFLGIPPKGEHAIGVYLLGLDGFVLFPISRDPPEGGTYKCFGISNRLVSSFPISRDPPEGGTCADRISLHSALKPSVSNF